MSRRQRRQEQSTRGAELTLSQRRNRALRTLGILSAFAAVVVGAVVWWQNAAAVPPRQAPNILLVTLDTTRADRLGAYGYSAARTPSLDRLARDGVLFERALTSTPTTLPAHVSLLTGLYPGSHGVRNNGIPLNDSVPTLASRLHGAGYRTAAFVSSFVLDRRFGLARGFDRYDDRLDPKGVANELVERRGDRTGAAAEQWLTEREIDGVAASGHAPFFLWVHLYDAHDPYEPPSPFRDTFADRPYDGEIAFADSVLGSLMQQLDRLGLSSTTIVAVAGDHGESLGDHGEATHGMFVYEAAMRVPVIIRWPGQVPSNHRIAPLVRTIDLAPTLLELAGLPAIEGVEGQSLLPLVRSGTMAPVAAYGETYFPLLFMNWSALRSLQDDRWKFIEAPTPELYDLTTDPGEQTNLAAREPARTAALARALGALVASRRSDSTAAVPDRDTMERLAALGYVGLPTNSGSASGLARPDPKAMIGVFNRLRLANAALLDGRRDEAERGAHDVLATDPDNAFATLILAKAAMASGRYREAASRYRGYLTYVPTSADGHQWLAICLFQLGDEATALKEVDAALAIDPRFADAHELRGGLLSLAGRRDESLRALQAAVELNPESATFRLALGRALFRASRVEEAEREFRRAVELQPDGSDAHSAYGAALAARGQNDEAVREFRRALDLIPARHDVRLDLARALLALGRRDEASKEFQRLASGGDVPANIRNAARASLSK